MVVGFNQIRRKRVCYSREKNKLLLKQHVEQIADKWSIKQSTIDSLQLNNIQWDQIFDGPFPEFEVSKRREKKLNGTSNGKKVKQETLAKYLTKNNASQSPSSNNNNLLEQMKKRELEFKQKKEEIKQKRKEENLMVHSLMKDWYRPKEDLELEDQGKLPAATPIKCRIPDKHFGEVIMFMEFVNSFSKFVNPKDFFPSGLTLDLVERALIEEEVAGPFTDIIQMLLTAIFNLQEEETTQCRIYPDKARLFRPMDLTGTLTKEIVTRSAARALLWPKIHQGVNLHNLALYPLTVSEVLRLHLLASGARVPESAQKWRYQQRGGYLNEDDPGVDFCINEAIVVKKLSKLNVVELSMDEKIKVLLCLVSQILTYADVRDLIEERSESAKQTKHDLKVTLSEDHKSHKDYVTAKLKVKREKNANYEEELKNMEKEEERRHCEAEKKIKKLIKQGNENIIVLG